MYWEKACISSWTGLRKKSLLCYSLKLENPALLSQNARPAENCSSGTLLLQMHFTQKREAAVCLLNSSNNLMSSINFMDFLRKFNSCLTRCNKFDGKVHLTSWKKHTEWTEAEWVTQGPENTNIKEELPTESRGSDWTLHFLDSLCNEQGHKATAERAWVTVGFSQISWQEWLANFC